MIFIVSQEESQSFVLKDLELLRFLPLHYKESLISPTQLALLLHLVQILLPYPLVFQLSAHSLISSKPCQSVPSISYCAK